MTQQCSPQVEGVAQHRKEEDTDAYCQEAKQAGSQDAVLTFPSSVPQVVAPPAPLPHFLTPTSSLASP